MTGELVVAVVAILVSWLLAGYPLHIANRNRAEVATTAAHWYARYADERDRVDVAQAEAEFWRNRAIAQSARADSNGYQLTAERAYSNLCDRQLQKLAEQVAGQALLPTLAADDVVVAFPKRGAL